MTCTDAIEGKIMTGMLSATNPDASDGAIVTGASLETKVEDGTVGEFTFTANSDLTGHEIGLKDIVLADTNGTTLPYQVQVNGSIEEEETPSTPSTPSSPSSPSVEPEPSQEPEPQSEPESAPLPEPAPSPDPQPALEPVQGITFTDTKGHWGESFIARAAELGLFKGYPDGSFRPNLDVTRAQYVTVLYRMAGSPAIGAEAPFSDIASQSQEFRTAIAWGYEKGYLNGKGEGIFDPNGPVTRQEAMKILFGYDGGISGMEIMFTGIYDKGFTDSDQIAAWGKPAMYWGVYKSLITGTSDTTLSPNGTATRAQLAKILTGYYDLQNK
jgi:hypothetical protein